MPKKNKRTVAKEEEAFQSLLSFFTHVIFSSYLSSGLTEEGVLFCLEEESVSNNWWQKKGHNLLPFVEVLYHLEKQPDGIEWSEEKSHNTENSENETLEQVLTPLRNSNIPQSEKEYLERALREVFSDLQMGATALTMGEVMKTDNLVEVLQKKLSELEALMGIDIPENTANESHCTLPITADPPDVKDLSVELGKEGFQALIAELPFSKRFRDFLEEEHTDKAIIFESFKEFLDKLPLLATFAEDAPDDLEANKMRFIQWLSTLPFFKIIDEHNDIDQMSLERLCFLTKKKN